MASVVSDAGPLHYLILIEAIDCLPKLFGQVFVPEAVLMELTHPATPSAVRTWLEDPPPWIELQPVLTSPKLPARQRGAGERAAIEVASAVGADFVLIDDRAGDAAARSCGLQTVGTLGILVRSAQLGLVSLETAFDRLRKTNFRCRSQLLDELLSFHQARKVE